MTADELLKDLVHDTARSEPETDHHNRVIQKVWAEIVKPALVPDRNAEILDIGAGSGYALDLFGREGHRAIGVNYIKADADACRVKGLDCVEGDMHALRPYWGGKADIVWARHVLEHSPFPLLALYEFRRVLKPGGLLYIEVPSGGTACEHESNPSHFSIFSQKAWACLLVRSGFEILTETQLTFRAIAGEDCYFAWLCRRTGEKP